MANKKILLIINPCSGRGKIKNKLLEIVRIFSDSDFDVIVYPTKERADATVRVANIADGEFERIIVCGGDGTLNEVITGLMQSGNKCTLGYIPAGTLNEWSTGLNISKIMTTAAKDAIWGKEITLDIGKFGDKYFSYTASFGAFTEASYSAPQNIKNALGQAAYFFEGIKSLSNIKPVHLKFTCYEKEIEGDFLFGAISNSMSVGGIVKFNKNYVELNDGLFEVLLIKNPENIIKFQSVVDGILRQDLSRDGIEFFQTKQITVSGGKDVAWTLDGEYAGGQDNVTISNIHSAIKLIVPDKKAKKKS